MSFLPPMIVVFAVLSACFINEAAKAITRFFLD